MLLVKGGLISSRVRQPLLRPVLTCSAFSSLARPPKPVWDRTHSYRPGAISSNQSRQFGSILKKIKIGWLIGPPPRPGSKEDWEHCTKLVLLSFAVYGVFILFGKLTGEVTTKKDFFKFQREKAIRQKEEEEKAYEQALALAKLRMED